MKKIIHDLKSMIFSIVIGLVLGAGIIAVQAWTEPTATAPGGNLGAPINTSSIGQGKLGNLGVGTSSADADYTLHVAGDMKLNGQKFFADAATGSAVSIVSDSDIASQLLLRNSGNVAYGRLYGSTGASAYNFGLLNTDGEWSYQDQDDVATYFLRGASIKMTLLENGNVGIGTTSPSTNLHVVGGARITGLANCGKVYTDANGLLTCGTDGSGVTGSGTANYVPKWTAASTLGNSQIFDNGTNVGIAQVSPAQRLHVGGHIRSDGMRYYFGDSQFLAGDNGSAISLYSNNATVSQLLMRNDAGTVYGRLYGSTGSTGVLNFGLLNADGQWSYQDADDVATYFLRNGAIKMTILENGLVGIGTTAPAYALDVVGGIHASTNIFASSALTAGTSINAASAKISGLASCDTIDTDASGNLVCGSDNNGSSYSGINTGDCFTKQTANDTGGSWLDCGGNYAVTAVYMNGGACGGECINFAVKCCKVR